MASGNERLHRACAAAVLSLCSVACNDYSFTFYVDSVDATFEGCDFDSAHELRAQYLPWDESELFLVENDPITNIAELCTVQTDPFFDESKKTWCITVDSPDWTTTSSFSGEILDENGEPKASYLETVEVHITPHVDPSTEHLFVDGTVRRIRTCHGDCVDVPEEACHVTVHVSAGAETDYDYALLPAWPNSL